MHTNKRISKLIQLLDLFNMTPGIEAFAINGQLDLSVIAGLRALIRNDLYLRAVELEQLFRQLFSGFDASHNRVAIQANTQKYTPVEIGVWKKGQKVNSLAIRVNSERLPNTCIYISNY